MAAETSSQLIFFIAATLVAAVAAGALTTVVFDLSNKMEAKGKALGATLVTEVRFVNDPARVEDNPVVFYVKNTGTTTLSASLATVLVDGALVTTTPEVIGSSTLTWRPTDVAKFTYTANLNTGQDYQARIITENGVTDDLDFRVEP